MWPPLGNGSSITVPDIQQPSWARGAPAASIELSTQRPYQIACTQHPELEHYITGEAVARFSGLELPTRQAHCACSSTLRANAPAASIMARKAA